MIKDSVLYTNLLSFDDDPDWVVRRYPVTGTIPIANLQIGMLVKFDATRANVQGAVGADDAVLEGIVVDLPWNTEVPSSGNQLTVAVGFAGSYNKNHVTYADGTSPISVAGTERLRDLQIFLDTGTPAGPFAP